MFYAKLFQRIFKIHSSSKRFGVLFQFEINRTNRFVNIYTHTCTHLCAYSSLVWTILMFRNWTHPQWKRTAYWNTSLRMPYLYGCAKPTVWMCACVRASVCVCFWVLVNEHGDVNAFTIHHGTEWACACVVVCASVCACIGRKWWTPYTKISSCVY